MTISIVFAFDNNAFMPMMVSIESLLHNKAPSTFYEIICLAAELNEEHYNDYFNKLKKRYTHFSIRLIDMKNIFSNIKSDKDHISFVTYYRLKIPDILKEHQKVLYIDTDTIIRKDLATFWSIPLEDQLLGAIKDPACFDRVQIKQYRINQGEYFNAGVLLMNLEQIRREQKTEEWIPLIQEGFPVVDQGLLNAVCVGRVVFLPFEYNSIVKYFDRKRQRYLKYFNPDNTVYKRNFSYATILHYTGPDKPWKYHDIYARKEWDKFYLMSDFKFIPLKRARYYKSKFSIRNSIKNFIKIFFLRN